MPKPMSVYAADAPRVVRDFLTYISTIRGKSARTAQEYYLDLRMFLRFLRQYRGEVPALMPFEEISIAEIDLPFLQQVTLSEAYAFLEFIATERPVHAQSTLSPQGVSARTRARKTSAIRAFFAYLTDKVALLQSNPVANLEAPARRKSLPRYLTVQDSTALLTNVGGAFIERDFCILLFFLSCGMRVSELVGLNLTDISLPERTLRVLGKGNKERMLYLNDACVKAYEAYLNVRLDPHPKDANAVFISRNRNRINVQTVKWLVKKHITEAGLDPKQYSVHKLRHTAATLMYQNGVDIRTLQTVLGHANLDTTMIYTHIEDANIRRATASSPFASMERKTVKDVVQEVAEHTDIEKEPTHE